MVAFAILNLVCHDSIPQVIRNYRRQSVVGLSMLMFTCSILANLCYGIQLLLRLPTLDASFWGATLPFLIGSIGTLVWDATVFAQAWRYRRASRRGAGVHSAEVEEERRRLIDS